MKLEDIKDMIPYYLTKTQAEGLILELEKFNCGTQLYSKNQTENLLQGDGWKGFQIFNFSDGSRINTRGILLSNSCDIDPSNPRNIPAKVTFVPLVRLNKLKQMYLENGIDAKKVDNIINSITKQENTQFFFLPAQTTLDDDYVAWLSDIHSMPSDAFLESEVSTRLFSLNLTGFYLFLLKISIHFCRFHEKVDRSDTYAT